MRIDPLMDRIIVKRAEAKELAPQSTIIIPERAREKPQEGIVQAVGSGWITPTGVRVPLECQPGDRVLFGKFVGIEVSLDGETVLVLREADLIGILRPSP